MISRDQIVQIAADATFNKPLITNVYRSVIAEALVASVLPDWRWCSADYFPYDFDHPSGARLEVKQSAVKQSWDSPNGSKPSWDIAARKGFYEGANWVERAGRNADIYVLALHDRGDATADHREPSQWVFYVVPAAILPDTKRLSRKAAYGLVEPVRHDGLAGAVSRAMTFSVPPLP